MLFHGVLDRSDTFRLRRRKCRRFRGTRVLEVAGQGVDPLRAGMDSDHRLIRIVALVQMENCAQDMVGGWSGEHQLLTVPTLTCDFSYGEICVNHGGICAIRGGICGPWFCGNRAICGGVFLHQK